MHHEALTEGVFPDGQWALVAFVKERAAVYLGPNVETGHNWHLGPNSEGQGCTSYGGWPFGSSQGMLRNHFLNETWPSPLDRNALAIFNVKRTAFM